MVNVGDAAPEVTLRDHSDREVKLSDYRGKRVVLWFYPKADTPGCTREGCGFRDLYAQFQAKGAEVLGVSFDAPADNEAFVQKYEFPYPLLSDASRELARAFGAYSEQQPDYAQRNTYVIDADGKVERVFDGVNPKTHPKDLLDSLG